MANQAVRAHSFWDWRPTQRCVYKVTVCQTVMEAAGISAPQACPKGLHHGFGITAATAGVPLLTIATSFA